MDRRRRNLRHEQNKAFERALAMETVGPNSYHSLFESAQNVCLLKLPNDPNTHYHGLEDVKSAFIKAASTTYFSTLPGNIAFAFYDSFYNGRTPERALNQEQAQSINMFHARLRIAGRKHEIGSSFQEAFQAGVTAIGSIETMTMRGTRILLDIPNLTRIVHPLFQSAHLTAPENTVYLGYIAPESIVRTVGEIGVKLYNRDEVIDRVLWERYGVPPKPSKRKRRPEISEQRSQSHFNFQ